MEMNFMIKSKVLEKLKPKIIKAVDKIKKHIDEKHQIIIRHHTDTDGYSGAVALEKAILPLIHKTHSKERNTWYVYNRRPNPVPYYAYEDANKDLSILLSDKGNYKYKKPLVIIVDTGSSKESLLALKKLKLYDINIIVIDHHPVSSLVDDFIDVHINPNHVGSDYDLSAGMICAEIAKLLSSEIKDAPLFAALAAQGDKVTSKERDDYFMLSNKLGYTEEFIITLSEVIDYEGQFLRFIEARQIIDDLFGGDYEKQKGMINILKGEIENRKLKALHSALKYLHVSKTQKKNIVIIPIKDVNLNREYPNNGKIVGMVHDFYKNKEDKPVISLGFNDDSIIFRGTDDSGLDVNDIIKKLNNKFSHAQISGGGHAKAGSIKFIPASFKEVKSYVLELIRK